MAFCKPWVQRQWGLYVRECWCLQSQEADLHLWAAAVYESPSSWQKDAKDSRRWVSVERGTLRPLLSPQKCPCRTCKERQGDCIAGKSSALCQDRSPPSGLRRPKFLSCLFRLQHRAYLTRFAQNCNQAQMRKYWSRSLDLNGENTD